jgi:hypothetical protein
MMRLKLSLRIKLCLLAEGVTRSFWFNGRTDLFQIVIGCRPNKYNVSTLISMKLTLLPTRRSRVLFRWEEIDSGSS